MKPEDINQQFADAYNSGSIDGLVNLYEPDALVELGPGGPMRGTAAIREALTPFVALAGTLSFERRFCHVSGDLAVISIEYRLVGGRAPNGARVDTGGATVELARRQPDGTWKYVIDLPAGALPSPSR